MNIDKRLLLWIGLGMVVLGPIIAVTQKSTAESAAFQAELDGAAMGYMWDIEPNYTGMWVGIIIAGLGVIALFLWLQSRGNE